LRFLRSFLLLAFLFLSLNSSQAQTKNNKLGIIIGQWQPNTLRDDKPASLFKGTASSTPYLAINYDRLVLGGVKAHFSIGYWSHLFEEPGRTYTIKINPIEIGIEHELIDDFIISPYVLYGAGLLFGKSQEGDQLKNISLNNFGSIGIDLFLLTGIRITPFQPIDVDINFGYLYAKFPKEFGSTTEFSGVRASVGINYLF